MGILNFLFSDIGPLGDPLSPVGLNRELNRRSTLMAKRMVSMNSKRRNELETLRTTVARLALVVETQQRLLLQKGVFTGAEYDALLQSVDAEDGSVDGQIRN